MIETNNPEIDVDKLMQVIREEVARYPSVPLSEEPVTSSDRLGTSTVNSNSISFIENLLTNAESYSQVPIKFPDKLNRFPFNIIKQFPKSLLKLYGFLFKKQRVVNFSLIQALKNSLALNRQLTDQVAALQLQMNEMREHLEVTDERLKATDERLKATDECLKATDEHLKATDERLAGKLTATDQYLKATDERYIRNDIYLKNDLAQQKRLVSLFLEEAHKRLPEPFNQEQIQTFANEDQHLLDAFYVAFEDRFRGSTEDIFNRLKVYLPLIEEAKVCTPDFPILDLGCGRGEWLELLNKSGYTAKGIDLNRVMIEQCRTKGLDVSESDVIAYLRSLPDGSIGAVTGFHIIEHLPFTVLMKLFAETVRVLKPKGLAIFETPNPENILVGSSTFYTDPTHRNPLPSLTVKFMAELSNFSFVEIVKLHPYPQANHIKEEGNEIAERFNTYFYGPQDYAIIGYK